MQIFSCSQVRSVYDSRALSFFSYFFDILEWSRRTKNHSNLLQILSETSSCTYILISIQWWLSTIGIYFIKTFFPFFYNNFIIFFLFCFSIKSIENNDNGTIFFFVFINLIKFRRRKYRLCLHILFQFKLLTHNWLVWFHLLFSK